MSTIFHLPDGVPTSNSFSRALCHVDPVILFWTRFFGTYDTATNQWVVSYKIITLIEYRYLKKKAVSEIQKIKLKIYSIFLLGIEIINNCVLLQCIFHTHFDSSIRQVVWRQAESQCFIPNGIAAFSWSGFLLFYTFAIYYKIHFYEWICNNNSFKEKCVNWFIHKIFNIDGNLIWQYLNVRKSVVKSYKSNVIKFEKSSNSVAITGCNLSTDKTLNIMYLVTQGVVQGWMDVEFSILCVI